MNYVDKFDAGLFSSQGAFSGAGESFSVDVQPRNHVLGHGGPDTIVVPDAHLLFSGDYKRSGLDLVLSKDNHEFVVRDYFRGDGRATLASPDGANLTGKTVEALTGQVDYAQAGGTIAPDKVIGQVTKLTGSATAVRNGVSISLNVGDNVHKGDVVQSGSDSSLGITFIDGTVFGLSSNARMVLNEMVYNPAGSNNSSLLTLVQGTISFVAGATAKNGDMKVETPTATMGIRGTAVLVEIDFDIPQPGLAPPVSFRILVEPNGTTGEYVLLDKLTLQPIATVNQPGTKTVVNGQGVVTFFQSADIPANAQRLINEIFTLKFTDANPKLIGIPPLDTITPQTFLVKLPDGTPIDQLPIIRIALVFEAVGAPPPSGGNNRFHLNIPPELVAAGNHFTERFLTTGNTALDTVSGTIHFDDINPEDRPTVTAQFNSFVYRDAQQDVIITSSLTLEQLAAIQAVQVPLSVVPDPNNTNIGDATWTYNVPDHAFDFLAAGETLTLIYMARVDTNYSEYNTVVFTPFKITITGTNDLPTVLGGGSNVVELPGTYNPVNRHAGGVITFADVDLTDRPTVTASLPTAIYKAADGVTLLSLTADQLAAVGVALTLTPSLTNTNNGSVAWSYDVFDNSFDFIAVGETIVLHYTVTVDDGHGGVVSVPLTVTVGVNGTNDAPSIDVVAQQNLIEQTDISALTATIPVTFTDVDLTDVGHTAQVTQAVASGVTTGLGLNEAALKALLTPGTVTKASGSSSGSVNLAFSAASTAFDYLGVGDTLTLTYTVAIDDHDGGITPRTFIVTVTGTNDAPVIDTIAQQNLPEQTGTGALTATIAVTFTDVDLTDVGHTATVIQAVTTGVTTGLALDQAALIALVTPSTVVKASGSSSGSVNLAFSAASTAFDYLGVGDTLTLTYTVAIDDHDGGITPRTFIVTVTGTNDAPVIDTIAQQNLPEQTGTGALTATIPVTFTDVDLTDIGHTAEVTHAVASGATTGLGLNEAALKALVTPSTVTKTSGASSGSVDLAFSAASIAFDYLGVGDTLTLTYTVAINDLDGGITPRTFVVTIAGTNDAPVINAIAQQNLTERTDANALTATIPVTFTDVDLTDIGHTATVIQAVTTGVTTGLALDQAALIALVTPSTVVKASGSSTGSLNLGFSAASTAFDYLAAGEALTLTYTVATDDHDGGTTPQTFVVTITGTNDAPAVVADTSLHAITEIAGITGDTTAGTASGSLAFTDVDLTDTHTVDDVLSSATWSVGATLPTGLTATLETALATSIATDSTGIGTGSVGFTFSAADNNFDFLAEGEILTVTYNITVTDDDLVHSVQPVTITITGADDAPEIITGSAASVNEAVAAHTTVFTVTATDPDDDSVAYSLVAGGDASAFTIDSLTGIVTINATPDFETKPSYSFTVRASDEWGLFDTQAITININDLAPVISSGSAASVNEGVAANTAVYTAAAADPGGGAVIYSLTGTDAMAFTIDSLTGVVTINATPDFETKPSYSFTVRASDALGLFDTQAITININDLAPVISSGSTASVNEGVAANTTVYTAAAVDPAGGTVIYSLTGTDASAFTIDSSTGVVTINATPDFETNSSYSFSVKASDASGASSTQAVTLGVNDLPPVISSGTTASINENVAANTIVYTAAAADPAGGAVTYALTGADASAFTINASTGVVTINNTPDFETKPSYSFSVKARDASGSFTTQAVTLSINLNEPPVISGDLAIALYQGGKVVLTTADLAAADVDNSASQLTFNVTATTRGHVALASAPATTITSFTQAQLAAGLVAFVSDGTANATASFTVTATDGAATLAPVTVNAAVTTVANNLVIPASIDLHDTSATINSLTQYGGTLTGTGTLIVTGSAALSNNSIQSGSGTTIFRTDTAINSLINLTIDGRSLEFESVSASNPVDLIFDGTGGSNTTMLLNNGASLRFGSTVIGNAVVGSTLKVLQNKITIGTTMPGALGSVVFEDNSSLRLETFASLALNVGSVVFENNATWDLGQGASVVFNAPVSAVAHAVFGQWRIGSGDEESSVTFTHGLDLTPDLSGSTYQTDPFGHPAWYNSSEGVYWYGSWNYSGGYGDALGYAVSGVPNVTIVGDDLVPLRAAHVTFVNSTVANDWQAIEKLTLINSSMVGGNYIDFVATKSYEVLGGTVVTIYVSSGFDYYYYDLPGNVAKLRIDDGTVFLNHQSGTVPAFRGGLDIDHNATIDATDVPIPYPAPTITLGAQSVSNWGQAGMNFTLDHLVVTTGNVDYATIHAYYGTINLNNRSQIVLTYFGRFDDGLGFAGDGLTIQSTAGSGSVINGGQWILRSSTGSGMHVNVEFNTNGGSVQLLNSQSKLTLAGGGTDVNAHYTGVGTVLFAGGTRTIDSGSDISTAKISFTGGTTTLDGSYGVSATTVSGGAANLLGASTSLGAVTISGGTLNLGGGSDTAASLTQSGGTLTGTGTLTVSGAAAFSGGTESGSGTTIVNGAATFFTASNQTLTLDTGRVIDLKGSAQTGAFAGETIHLNGAAQLIVDTGVTFTDQGTGSGAAGFTIDGDGTLKVFGSYTKTGIGTTDISAAVVNSGTIDVQAGTMTLASVTNTGTLQAESGGTLHLTGADTGTGAVTIGHNGTVEFGGSVAAGQTITFTDTTGYLKLDAPAIFAGTIAGFSGTAPDAANSDVIELVGIGYATMTYSYVAGVLTIGDGTDSATLKFAGFGGTFVFAADADGDTLIFDPPAAPTAAGDGASAAPNQTGSVSIGTAGSDNFVFKPGIGAGTILDFNSQQDTIEFDNFADVHAVEQLVSAITSDVHGNVVIGLGHGDSITIAGMTESQFHAIAQSAIHLH